MHQIKLTKEQRDQLFQLVGWSKNCSGTLPELDDDASAIDLLVAWKNNNEVEICKLWYQSTKQNNINPGWRCDLCVKVSSLEKRRTHRSWSHTTIHDAIISTFLVMLGE